MKTWHKIALVVFLFLTSIAITGYVYRETPIINSLFAATTCTNGQQKTVSGVGNGVYYCCKAGKWVNGPCPTTTPKPITTPSDCTQVNQYGYYGFKNTNDVCNKAGITTMCGGKKYCCRTSGQKWILGECGVTCLQVAGYYGYYAIANVVCNAKGITTVCGGVTYCCPGIGKWVVGKTCGGTTTQSCTNTPSGSNYMLNGAICDTPIRGTSCNNVDYCCPGPGKEWVKCSSIVTPEPKKNPTTAPVVIITQPPPAPPPVQKTKPTKSPSQLALAGCYDYGCVSQAQGNLWGLVNCGVTDPDGDMQLCDGKGRIGECQAQKQCCPGSGQKWTTDMTACPVTQATLTVSPTDLAAGSTLTVTWNGIPGPSGSDWLGMYIQGETNERNTVEWNYVNTTTCAKTTGDGKASGTCSFTLPTSIATGTYELRLYSNNTFTKLATSNTFTVKGTTTGQCCACPAPTPSYLQSMCNGPCMTSNNCPTGQVCLLADTYGWVCRNPACVDTPSCSCSATLLTPTPTQKIVYASCNEDCSSTSDCRTGYQCVYINDENTAVCRNPKCFSSRTCVCGIEIASPTPASASGTPSPTGLRLNALPTPSPTPNPILVNPSLTIKPFTDSTGKASSKFTLTGTSDPFTEIDIRFDPDSIGQTTSSDSKGDWRYILTKALTTGRKDLIVTARSSAGGETQVKQSFTVKGGSSFFSLFLGFLVLAAIGGIGFYIYQKQMRDQSSLFSQFPPFTPTSEETESTPSSEQTSEQPKVSSETPSETPTPEPFISSEGEKPSPEETKDESRPPFT